MSEETLLNTLVDFHKELNATRAQCGELLAALETATNALSTIAAYKYCLVDGAGRAETNEGIRSAVAQIEKAAATTRAAIAKARDDS